MPNTVTPLIATDHREVLNQAFASIKDRIQLLHKEASSLSVEQLPDDLKQARKILLSNRRALNEMEGIVALIREHSWEVTKVRGLLQTLILAKEKENDAALSANRAGLNKWPEVEEGIYASYGSEHQLLDAVFVNYVRSNSVEYHTAESWASNSAHTAETTTRARWLEIAKNRSLSLVISSKEAMHIGSAFSGICACLPKKEELPKSEQEEQK